MNTLREEEQEHFYKPAQMFFRLTRRQTDRLSLLPSSMNRNNKGKRQIANILLQLSNHSKQVSLLNKTINKKVFISMLNAHQNSVPGSTCDAFSISRPGAALDENLLIIAVCKHALHIDCLPLISS